jgi:hypothetical protein
MAFLWATKQYTIPAIYPTIGSVEKKFAETDISLVKLHSDVHYASQTFSSELRPATEITSLKDPTDLLLGDILTMENAFSGCCEGYSSMPYGKQSQMTKKESTLGWSSPVSTWVTEERAIGRKLWVSCVD